MSDEPKPGSTERDRAIDIVWRLRMVAAERGVWSGAELARLIKDKGGRSLSPPSISALMTKQPREIRLETLGAICAALDCTPGDLFALTNDHGDGTSRTTFDRIGADSNTPGVLGASSRWRSRPE